MRDRKYHERSGKRRWLAVVLAAALVFGMGTMSVRADSLPGGTEEAGEMSETETGETLVSEPVQLNLGQSEASGSVPEHHKYIRYDGNDTYTLTLNVTGAYASETTRPKVDVLLIVDQSSSMGKSMGQQDPRSRMTVLQDVVSGQDGLTDMILGADTLLDARIAVVGYSGTKKGIDSAYDDAWVVQDWTAVKSAVDQSVKAMSPQNGTNWEAGFRTGASVLQSARAGAEKIAIFLSDGEPTFYYNRDGYTTGNGGDYDAQAYAQAQTQLAAITGLSGFYTIGFGTEWESGNTNRMNTILNSASAASKQYYAAKNSEELEDAFQRIAETIEYTCRNVTITDVLSDYAEIPKSGFTYSVTATKDGTETDITEDGIVQVTYDSETKMVKAIFQTGFVLDADTVYGVHFQIQPSQKAYDEYADGAGSYPHTGSAGSDAPGNATSAGKGGFYTNVNENVTLDYTYGTESAEAAQVSYAEAPVLQVSDMAIPVYKQWENVGQDTELPDSVEIRLYQDQSETPYRTLELTAEGQWSGTFQHVAKGHSYRVEEVEIDGYESVITGSLDNGYTVTNTKNPTLVISKLVEGELGNRNKAFEIRIKLTDADGAPISGTFGGQTFDENGETKILLKHNESVSIAGLPVGANYEVTETEANQNGFTTSYENAAGVLTTDQEVTVYNRCSQDVPDSGIGMTGSFLAGCMVALMGLCAMLAAGLRYYRRYGGK